MMQINMDEIMLYSSRVVLIELGSQRVDSVGLIDYCGTMKENTYHDCGRKTFNRVTYIKSCTSIVHQ